MRRLVSGFVLVLLAAHARREEPPVSRELRVVLELVGGVAGSLIGGASGYGVGVGSVADDVAMAHEDNGVAGLARALFGGVPGLAIGLPIRLYLIGEACGGDGSYWATWGGVVAGSVIPLVATLVLAPDDPQNPGLVALWVALPSIGGVIGYELSQRDALRASAPARVWIAPIPGGFELGIRTRFR